MYNKNALIFTLEDLHVNTLIAYFWKLLAIFGDSVLGVLHNRMLLSRYLVVGLTELVKAKNMENVKIFGDFLKKFFCFSALFEKSLQECTTID